MHEIKKEDLNILYIDREDYDYIDSTWDSAKLELKWWNVALLVIFNKNFRWLLKDTLLYAIRWENTIRGGNSCDAFSFKCSYSEKVFKNSGYSKNKTII